MNSLVCGFILLLIRVCEFTLGVGFTCVRFPLSRTRRYADLTYAGCDKKRNKWRSICRYENFLESVNTTDAVKMFVLYRWFYRVEFAGC